MEDEAAWSRSPLLAGRLRAAVRFGDLPPCVGSPIGRNSTGGAYVALVGGVATDVSHRKTSIGARSVSSGRRPQRGEAVASRPGGGASVRETRLQSGGGAPFRGGGRGFAAGGRAGATSGRARGRWRSCRSDWRPCRSDWRSCRSDWRSCKRQVAVVQERVATTTRAEGSGRGSKGRVPLGTRPRAGSGGGNASLGIVRPTGLMRIGNGWNAHAPLAKGRAPLAKGRAPLAKGRAPLAKGRAPLAKGHMPLAKERAQLRDPRAPARACVCAARHPHGATDRQDHGAR